MWTIIILFIPIAILLIILDSAIKKNQDKNKIEQNRVNHNALVGTIGKHVCGLPIAENSECQIFLNDKGIIIENKSNIFTLEKNKILDVSLKSSKEIKNSLSGAIGGALLLGPIGAFLGADKSETKIFLIIIYKKKEKEECISFQIEIIADRCKNARCIVKEFENNITEKKEIEL